MPTSPTIAALAAALVKTQSAMGGAKKDSTNPHFKTAYADLASVWDACRAPLANAGLSVVQLVSSERLHPSEATHAVIETILAHSSGEWVSSTLAVPLTKSDAQGLGSAITYGRRYALAAIVGVCPADDDGEAAVARPTQFTAVINKRPSQPAQPAQRAQEPDDVPMKHPTDKFRKPTTQTADIDEL